MDDHNLDFSLVVINNSLMERQTADKILACNEEIGKYGLSLTEQQALALVQTRTNALKENKRIELNGFIVDKLILAFCNSPYIKKDTYEDTLHELINLFYGDRMNDREYQKLVERILQTDGSEGKITLILNEVHSLADLLDILSDTELYANDFDLLINMLPLPAFVMLLSQYPNEDFWDRESEQLLFAALQKRKQQLSMEETQQIEQMINTLQREEI